jgi:hypothetical protein
MKPQSSLPHSQEPAMCPYPEPAQSITLNHTSLRSVLILSSHLLPVLPSGLFPSGKVKRLRKVINNDVIILLVLWRHKLLNLTNWLTY